jgi:hypothetical protein
MFRRELRGTLFLLILKKAALPSVTSADRKRGRRFVPSPFALLPEEQIGCLAYRKIQLTVIAGVASACTPNSDRRSTAMVKKYGKPGAPDHATLTSEPNGQTLDQVRNEAQSQFVRSEPAGVDSAPISGATQLLPTAFGTSLADARLVLINGRSCTRRGSSGRCTAYREHDVR